MVDLVTVEDGTLQSYMQDIKKKHRKRPKTRKKPTEPEEKPSETVEGEADRDRKRSRIHQMKRKREKSSIEENQEKRRSEAVNTGSEVKQAGMYYVLLGGKYLSYSPQCYVRREAANSSKTTQVSRQNDSFLSALLFTRRDVCSRF